MGRKAKDMTGQVYGRLTVVKRSGSNSFGQAMWSCLCSCGKDTTVSGVGLRTGTQSCGCLLTEQNKSVEKRAKLSLADSLGPKRKILRNYIEGAKSRGLVWKLTEEQACLLIVGHCYYCGDSHTMTKYGMSHNGIDRKNPKHGYTQSNCVSCCKLCNRAKSNFTLKEFLLWVKRVHKHQFGENS